MRFGRRLMGGKPASNWGGMRAISAAAIILSQVARAQSWQAVDQSLLLNYVCCDQSAQTLYGTYQDGPVLLKSTNGGATWSEVLHADGAVACSVDGAKVSVRSAFSTNGAASFVTP